MRFTIARTLAVVIAVGALACQAAPKPDLPATVADPRYGVALYHYYQGDYWHALSELMVAETRGGIEGHGDRPPVMEGAFSLAYGLEDRAATIFHRLLDQDEDVAARDSAWFYLAKLRYLLGDWSGAAAVLDNVSQEPPVALRDAVFALRVNLAIRQNQLDQAEQLLANHSTSDEWSPYLYYNLAVARSRGGEVADAIAAYEQMLELPLQSEELLALYDRAMTAAGYTYLHGQQFPDAQAQFARVRAGSPMASTAMLGYGWAAAEQEKFHEALTTWQRLADSAALDENGQEALLAVPYAYEQLGDPGLALRRFQQAERRFQAEHATLQQVVEGLDSNSIAEALQIGEAGNFNWLNYVADNTVEPQLVYLADLFAQDRFQSQVQELRDLLDVRQRLTDWRDKLELYSGLLDERQASRNEHLHGNLQQQLTQQIDDLTEQRNALAEKLRNVEEQQDYLALATEDEADLHQRAARAADNIEHLASRGEDTQQARERQRRYAGLLLWQASESFAPRLWEARRQVTQLDEQLQELESRRERVARAVSEAADLTSYRQRVQRNQERVAGQLNELEGTLARAQQALYQQVVAELATQQERLDSYLAQARLAVARLHDSTKVEQQP